MQRTTKIRPAITCPPALILGAAGLKAGAGSIRVANVDNTPILVKSGKEDGGND